MRVCVVPCHVAQCNGAPAPAEIVPEDMTPDQSEPEQAPPAIALREQVMDPLWTSQAKGISSFIVLHISGSTF